MKLLAIALLLLPYCLCYGQEKHKKDTVFYLVDTAKTPTADQMFLAGAEGNIYGFRLNCRCNRWNTDAFFLYPLEEKGVELSQKNINQINFITLRSLIDIVAQFGIDAKRTKVFYFVEPFNNRYIKHEVFLREAINSETLYGTQKAPKTQ